MSQDRHLPVVVGITAASGAALTERCITWLAAHGVPLYVTCSSNGRLVWQQELDESLEEAAVRWSQAGDVTLVDVGDEAALIASGSLLTAGMIIVPCSTGSAAAIANGICTNVLHRAAEVTIKERRPLVLMPRETPLSAIHLESWLKLARLGVTIVPPHAHVLQTIPRTFRTWWTSALAARSRCWDSRKPFPNTCATTGKPAA